MILNFGFSGSKQFCPLRPIIKIAKNSTKTSTRWRHSSIVIFWISPAVLHWTALNEYTPFGSVSLCYIESGQRLAIK